MAAAESCAEDDAAASGGAEKENSKGKGKESILAVTAVHDLAVKKFGQIRNLREFSKVILVRFDELETVRSFLNQELHVVEMAPR